MAKQTFTTGQVLTAAQMTSLQQTAMLGGAASAKTASYVLVAADAGDAITMSNAGATTITANTGLFATGDIVTIINIGTGACTITAGTATVTTSGSLVLAQNQGGVLRFTSPSEAIFLQFATPASGDIEGVTAGTGLSGGGTSGTVTITNSMATAMTTKGDIIVATGSGTFVREPVGTNNQVLMADSAQAEGVKYANEATATLTTTGDLLYASAANTLARRAIGSTNQVLTVSGGLPTWATPAGATVGFTLLSTTGLSGATTTISGISGQQTLLLLISGATSATASCSMTLQFNSDTAGNYGFTAQYFTGASSYSTSTILSNANPGDTEIPFGRGSTGGTYMDGTISITGCNSTSSKIFNFTAGGAVNGGNNHRSYAGGGFYKGTSTISSINIKCSGGTFNGGTAYLYGSAN